MMQNYTLFVLLGLVLISWDCKAQLIGTHSGSAGTEDVHFELCRTECPVNTDDSSPVCGTDGKTYPNIESLECAARCGKSMMFEWITMVIVLLIACLVDYIQLYQFEKTRYFFIRKLFWWFVS